MDQKYEIGQRIKLITIEGSDPAIDREINALAGRTGKIVRSYCITRDEMPDRIKSFVYPDFVYSYDIQLDDGEIVRGMPEAALEPENLTRR